MSCHPAEDGMVERASLYALGALTEDEARSFAEHLDAGCEACAAELLPFRAVVSLLGAGTPELEPPTAAREKLLKQIAGAITAPNSTKPLNGILILRADQGTWQPVAKGIEVKQLFVDRQNRTVTSLFRFAPGTHIPVHRHSGIEQCLVIEGDFHLNGEVFGPGDFSCALPGSLHESNYSEAGALVLIVAHDGYQMS